jgi:hypothetical protein
MPSSSSSWTCDPNASELLAFKVNNTTAIQTFSIQGKITKNLLLQPKESRSYREKVRERGLKATTRPEAQAITYEDSRAMTGHRIVDFIPPVHAE